MHVQTATKVTKQNLYRAASGRPRPDELARFHRSATSERIHRSVRGSTSTLGGSLPPFYYDYNMYGVWYVYVCTHAVEEEYAPMSGRRRLMA